MHRINLRLEKGLYKKIGHMVIDSGWLKSFNHAVIEGLKLLIKQEQEKNK